MGTRIPALTRQNAYLPVVSFRLVPVRSHWLPAGLFSGLDGVKSNHLMQQAAVHTFGGRRLPAPATSLRQPRVERRPTDRPKDDAPEVGELYWRTPYLDM